ncbi:MAG TPA: zf-HC2 domain-containing protein [Candidatus Baltobacteraceae bacterium]|nr:zf-HC2 domain-containing protein [Candidatus Baltobacteraceae bacterium]
MLDDHIGENAELYALGQLGELESSRVEHHVRSCDSCAKRVGEAEATVLRLIESGDVVPAPAQLDRRIRFSGQPQRMWIAAIAAAFLIGLLPWGVSTLRHPDVEAGSNQQLAMNAMLAGHFLHAPAVALVPGAPQAKVIYPRESGWLYVLVGGTNQTIDVVAITGNERTTIASIPPGPATRSAFVKISQRVSSVQLLEGNTPVASARIVYASPAP